jgi:phospholipase C
VPPWPTDHGWYDVEVTCPDDDAFRRLTGRVETGRDSVTRE